MNIGFENVSGRVIKNIVDSRIKVKGIEKRFLDIFYSTDVGKWSVGQVLW